MKLIYPNILTRNILKRNVWCFQSCLDSIVIGQMLGNFPWESWGIPVTLFRFPQSRGKAGG